MKEYMEVALDEAKKGTACQCGGPFGCVIIKDDHIVAKAHNEVLKRKDPTAHAEMLAIQQACKNLNSESLQGCDLYTTCEPCPMCLSAIIWSNIENIYYTCTKKDAASIGFRDDFIYEFLKGNNKSNLKLHPLEIEKCKDFFLNYDGKIY